MEVDRSGLVRGYVGQTASRTQEVIEEALGGVLFIDEAYALTVNKGENDFGQEAVDTLLKAMEDYRDDLVVIFDIPGYEGSEGKYLGFGDCRSWRYAPSARILPPLGIL